MKDYYSHIPTYQDRTLPSTYIAQQVHLSLQRLLRLHQRNFARHFKNARITIHFSNRNRYHPDVEIINFRKDVLSSIF